MKQFSDDDHFYKGFICGTRLANRDPMPLLDEKISIKELDDDFYKGLMYAMRLANEGLMPVLDKETPIEELIKGIGCLDRAKEGIEEFRRELSFKIMSALSEKLNSFKERIEEVIHV